MITRRTFMASSTAAAMAAASGHVCAASGVSLTARPDRIEFAGGDVPATAVWCYNGTVPGPALRYEPGAYLDVTLENKLPEPTTIHWHGLRPPVAMDGVPFLSQPPTAPDGRFHYAFPLTESGTYWYHPHIEGARQIGQGLHGVLIVEEAEPPDVDRELVWILDDWRMQDDAQLASFGNRHDQSHAGRIGNVVTVNGALDTDVPVRAGERIRLRLINVANARLFAPEFPMEQAWIVALDGHPVTPHRPTDGRVWLGPGSRADIVLDMTGEPGDTIRVDDAAYAPRQRFHLMSFVHGPEAPLTGRSSPPAPLRPHDLPEPDIEKATRHEVIFEGGAMGGLNGAHMGGQFLSMRELVEAGRFWAINRTVPENMMHTEPLFALSQGSSRIFAMANLTAFPHPIHLHGHVFRVLSVNGKPLEHRPWRDTVLLWPDMTVEIAFVADNPGKWMFHCHILEHQEAGMMAVVEVA